MRWSTIVCLDSNATVTKSLQHTAAHCKTDANNIGYGAVRDHMLEFDHNGPMTVPSDFNYTSAQDLRAQAEASLRPTRLERKQKWRDMLAARLTGERDGETPSLSGEGVGDRGGRDDREGERARLSERESKRETENGRGGRDLFAARLPVRSHDSLQRPRERDLQNVGSFPKESCERDREILGEGETDREGGVGQVGQPLSVLEVLERETRRLATVCY